MALYTPKRLLPNTVIYYDQIVYIKDIPNNSNYLIFYSDGSDLILDDAESLSNMLLNLPPNFTYVEQLRTYINDNFIKYIQSKWNNHFSRYDTECHFINGFRLKWEDPTIVDYTNSVNAVMDNASPYATVDTVIDIVNSSAGGSVALTHQQVSAAQIWIINHNLGYRPIAQTFDSGGNEIDGEIDHISVNQIKITYNIAVAGYARLV